MARKRPTASQDREGPVARRTAAGEVLTRAEVRALSRSAPLTKAEFKAHRLRADQRIEPLRAVLDRDVGEPVRAVLDAEVAEVAEVADPPGP